MSGWKHGQPPPGGWVPAAGVILLAAWIPLVRLPTLNGPGVVPFLCSFLVAVFAYLWAMKRLSVETPALWVIWIFAVSFRLVLLLTPVTLSNDVYRYIWDGHLLGQGVNPYAQIVQSPLLDGYATPLREHVDYPWMATPYLPAAQGYFALVERLAPQNPSAFQLASALLDLATGWLIMRTLRVLSIPVQAVLIYLWNPLVVVEFSHGAHVDALMLFFFALALYGLVSTGRQGTTLSMLALAAGVLVKGWPVLAAPVFVPRWGFKRVLGFAGCVAVPLALFAWEAGWGLNGPADGRGVFGALRIYAATWQFNSGLYRWLFIITGEPLARAVSVLAPALAGLWLGVPAWRAEQRRRANPPGAPNPIAGRKLLRWTALPFGLYLLLAPTVHPWYLTLILSLLPYFWPGAGETEGARRWIWPWLYFMFFEAFTYLAYTGVSAPGGLEWIRAIAYLPFWWLLLQAGSSALKAAPPKEHQR